LEISPLSCFLLFWSQLQKDRIFSKVSKLPSKRKLADKLGFSYILEHWLKEKEELLFVLCLCSETLCLERKARSQKSFSEKGLNARIFIGS
jgi:hypothetical protein